MPDQWKTDLISDSRFIINQQTPLSFVSQIIISKSNDQGPDPVISKHHTTLKLFLQGPAHLDSLLANHCQGTLNVRSVSVRDMVWRI
jgi:hypothetical protein